MACVGDRIVASPFAVLGSIGVISEQPNVYERFKAFVATQRPQLDIDAVATGETWFGEDAVARKLCDELKTFDDVLLGVQETPSTSLQHDFVRVDASDFC